MADFSPEELEKWPDDDLEDLSDMLRSLAWDRKHEHEKAVKRAAMASRALMRTWRNGGWNVNIGLQLVATSKAGSRFDRKAVRKQQHAIAREQMMTAGKLGREWRAKLDTDHQVRDVQIRYGLV